ncbi:MAG: hypothetical protein LBP94_06245 [Zoogloeaceae bacterium]|nr:hypothetical protein [Zoogloeaceae bacterium]
MTTLFFLVVCLGLTGGGCSPQPVLSAEEQMALWEKEGTVFRTGMKKVGSRRAGSITYAVSPDGARILFSLNGFWLLDLKSGHISRVPGEAGRNWAMPSWSRDGKQVVAISIKIQKNQSSPWEDEIILLDSANWSYRKLAVPPAGNSSPSFSSDGKSVYFIRGIKRKIPNGNKVYASSNLYVYDLVSDRENQLTHEEIWGGMGYIYDDGREVFFSARWLKRLPSMRPNPYFRNEEQAGIYVLNKSTLSLRLFEIDQREGFFNLLLGGRDKTGNIYFSTSLERPGGGNFIFTVYRCDANGQHCVRLIHEFYPFGNVDIAYQTGEIFVDDRLGDEIVFRRLFQPSEVQ